jgi:hypothetical protein
METLEKDSITTLEWLKKTLNRVDGGKMTTLNSDDDGPSTTWTSQQPNDNDD